MSRRRRRGRSANIATTGKSTQLSTLVFNSKTHRCASYQLLRAHIYLEHSDKEKKGVDEKKGARKVANGEVPSSNEKPGSSLWCEVCKVSSTSHRNHEEHLKGGKHKKKVREKGEPACEPCGLRFPHRQALLGHQQGRQHRQKVGQLQGKKGQNLGNSSSPSPGPSGRREPPTGGNNNSNRQGFAANLSHQELPSPDVFSHPSPAFRQRLCPDPDAFRPVAEMLCCPIDLQFALQGAGKYSRLTEDMVELFNCRQQRLGTMNQKIALWSEIYRAVRTDSDASLFVFGSTFNGFGAEGCDIDMCLFPQVACRLLRELSHIIGHCSL